MANTIIVGIDFGMTFTGVVFASVNSEQPPIIVNQWPDGLASKTLSRIDYVDNGEPEWGFSAVGNPTYTWFKQTLDTSTSPGDIRDEEFESLTNQELARLPPGIDGRRIVGDYLRQIGRFVANLLEDEIQKGSRIQFQFSTPVVWPDSAHDAMWHAIRDAGFGTTFPGDIRLSSESEAAARYILHKEGDNIKTNDVFCICDIGGCTVDSTCYRILSKQPALRLEQICQSRGNKSGAFTVDLKFLQCMCRRFGRQFKHKFLKSDGLNSAFVRQFNTIKEGFDGTEGEHRLVIELEAEESEFYDPDNSEIILTRRDMKDFFSQTINESFSLMQEQRDRAKYNHAIVRHMCITGGFADSAYARKRFHKMFPGTAMRLVFPAAPAMATSFGSALIGRQDASFANKRSARSYGIYHKDLLPVHPNNKERRIRERNSMSVRYTKRFELLHSSTDPLEKAIQVFSVDHAKPPTDWNKLSGGRSKMEKLESLSIDLTAVPLNDHPQIGPFTQILLDVEATLNLKQGELNIKVSAGNHRCGECTVHTVWA
ncbi:actin-like ATPase domain-containing protein [Aspergillus sclerotiicarbonarius CBS 121057]|uniref:Actin-like ATPase domain-containing protein n=1 Tax=Aspergillus sclerotiicarbonarius (strain CBS 121057 / IBT 28362) TaxID=1448318 RepID=A0A319EQF0_ASPSB|nr:actin-like ATPase domain-containing protein [Aspergillus sclerotiicarbonarius CBS 121057]